MYKVCSCRNTGWSVCSVVYKIRNMCSVKTVVFVVFKTDKNYHIQVFHHDEVPCQMVWAIIVCNFTQSRVQITLANSALTCQKHPVGGDVVGTFVGDS